METIEKNKTEKAVIEQFYRVQESKDLDAFVETLHDDIILYTPYAPSSFPSKTEGKQGVLEIWKNLFDNFGELLIPQYKVYQTDEEGYYMATWEVDIETPTGKRYQSSNIGTYRMKDGKIIEYVEFFNPLRFGKAMNLDLSADL